MVLVQYHGYTAPASDDIRWTHTQTHTKIVQHVVSELQCAAVQRCTGDYTRRIHSTRNMSSYTLRMDDASFHFDRSFMFCSSRRRRSKVSSPWWHDDDDSSLRKDSTEEQGWGSVGSTVYLFRCSDGMSIGWIFWRVCIWIRILSYIRVCSGHLSDQFTWGMGRASNKHLELINEYQRNLDIFYRVVKLIDLCHNMSSQSDWFCRPMSCPLR